MVLARSHSDLCFYAIKDGDVVNDETKGDLFNAVNTTEQCSSDSSCPTEPVSVSNIILPYQGLT